jgi:hypothetical protein
MLKAHAGSKRNLDAKSMQARENRLMVDLDSVLCRLSQANGKMFWFPRLSLDGVRPHLRRRFLQSHFGLYPRMSVA